MTTVGAGPYTLAPSLLVTYWRTARVRFFFDFWFPLYYGVGQNGAAQMSDSSRWDGGRPRTSVISSSEQP
jgi:hypothetical protein